MYTYDAWGNLISTTGSMANTLGVYNPLRYRGYVYDAETGLYYLQSRYYNPQWGRFVNADAFASTGQGLVGNNMFAYCLNNPVMRVDPSGNIPIKSASLFEQTLYGGGGINCGAIPPIPPTTNPTNDIISLGIIALVSTVAEKVMSWVTDDDDAEEKEKTEFIPPNKNNAPTYYHVTTADNAAAIMSSGVMTGSDLEGGYVYAWRSRPNKYAINNSGAHYGVTISFKTYASFIPDIGISDAKVLMYGPVVSVRPGPIFVWDVKIVG